MAPIDLKELAKRMLELKKGTTPTPWKYDGHCYVWGPRHQMVGMTHPLHDEPAPEGHILTQRGTGGGLPQFENMEYLTAAANSVEDLARGVLRLQKQREKVKEAIKEMMAIVDDCYEATGHVRVAKTSKQRLRLEALAGIDSTLPKKAK